MAATVVTATGAVIGGLAALDALTYTAQTVRITEQGQLTDRYTKAVEQLGSDKLDVRLGAIYALERLAGDSPRDRPAIAEMLSAFVRQRLPEATGTQCLAARPSPDARLTQLPVDQRAVLTVLGRRPDVDKRATPADLSRVCLAGWTDLSTVNLAYTDLRNAKLDHQWLDGVTLTGAKLAGASLAGATMAGADLRDADLVSTNLAGADLFRADLRDVMFGMATLNAAGDRLLSVVAADLTGANLASAQLSGATLVAVNLDHAVLIGSDLENANLSWASLVKADLRRADTTGASWQSADLTGATR